MYTYLSIHFCILCTASGWLSGWRVHSHAVGRGFAPRLGHTKDHQKKCTECLLAWHACVNVGV